MGVVTGLARIWLRRAAGVALVMVGAAVADWVLKAGAVAVGLHTVHHTRELPWAVVVLILSVNFVWFIFYASTPLLRLGIGLWFGGALGNLGELAALGHVTNFIPFPARYVASPADLCIAAGYAIFAIGLWKGVDGARRRKREKRVAVVEPR